MVRQAIKKVVLKAVNMLGTSSLKIGTPKKITTTQEWCESHQDIPAVNFQLIFPAKNVTELPPVNLDNNIPALFSNEFNRIQNESFVATISNGRVWGRYGAVVTSDDTFLYDVSREFGKYGGVFGKEHSIFKQIKLANVKPLTGRIAVVACAGSNNYHHWLYDTLPRIQLLKLVGIFDTIDYFIIDYTGLKFQKESLDLLGIPLNKIIACNNNVSFHVQAEVLIVPSLPARLGTISDWAIEFLRNTFLGKQHDLNLKSMKIYLSRRKAPTRKLHNEKEVFEKLSQLGYQEFFAEDHSICETARVFAQCQSIIGVHGSGFANLAFCSPGTQVIDILAPKHFDGYYWMLSNNTRSQYAYLFGKGNRLTEGTDLVKNKIDEDIDFDLNELLTLLKHPQIIA